ncbi:MAG: hypothetical protein ABH823_00490 [bacterium]
MPERRINPQEPIPLTNPVRPPAPPPPPRIEAKLFEETTLVDVARNPDTSFNVLASLASRAAQVDNIPLLKALLHNPYVKEFLEDLGQAAGSASALIEVLRNSGPLELVKTVVADSRSDVPIPGAGKLLEKYDFHDLFMLLKIALIISSKTPTLSGLTESEKLIREIKGMMLCYSPEKKVAVCHKLTEIAKDIEKLNPGLSGALRQIATN